MFRLALRQKVKPLQQPRPPIPFFCSFLYLSIIVLLSSHLFHRPWGANGASISDEKLPTGGSPRSPHSYAQLLSPHQHLQTKQ
ncbi:hypothetical protein AB1N83_007208 [Pleurotus pulmonarius]